jgi:flagellar biosynthetic protein FliQ
MTEDMVMSLGAEAIKVMIYIAGPLLLAAMAIGIVVSVIQAITQINEATLTFIPKIIAIVVVLMVMAPWMLEIMKQYTADILGNFREWIR